MAYLGPVKCEKLVQYFIKHGWSGPYRVRKHRFMIKGYLRLRLPDIPEDQLINVEMLRRILLQAGVDLD